MNRKQFFKKLGIGAAVCIAAPEVLAGIKPNNTTPVIIPNHYDAITAAMKQLQASDYKPSYILLCEEDYNLFMAGQVDGVNIYPAKHLNKDQFLVLS